MRAISATARAALLAFGIALTSVTAGGSTTTYALDGAGNRWSQATGGSSTSFDLDLSVPNPTILFDGTRKYLPGQPNAGFDQGGTWSTSLTDLAGTPVESVDTAGTVSGLVHSDPYGAPRPGSTATTGIGYAGEYRDATGLLNLRARSYDPVLGRFIGRDTFGGVASAPQTANRYSYATTNPLRFRDPSGRFIQTVVDNPGTVLEIAMTFNPVGASLVFGYMALTGTDPATGEHVSPELSALGLAAVFVPPVVAQAAERALTGLVRGLGNVVEHATGMAATATRDIAAASRDLSLGVRAGEGAIAGVVREKTAVGRVAGEADVAASSKVEAYRSSLPTRPAVGTGPANEFQVAHAGPMEYQISGGGRQVWADGINVETGRAIDAKLAGAQRSPFVSTSAIPAEIRSKILAKIEDEFAKYAAVVRDPANPLTGVTVVTNSDEAAAYFLGLMQKYGLAGDVRVVPQ